MGQKSGQLPEKPEIQVEVREMELEDLAPVFFLGERLFTAQDWPNLHRTWEEYALLDLFSSSGELCLVAEVGEQLAGFALGTLIEKRRSSWTYGWLLWLGVAPEFQRYKVGSRLTRRLTELFIEQGARMLMVDTEADNDEALAFFTRQGFGNPVEHVYLTRNLTTDPDYKRKRKKSKKTTSKRNARAASLPSPLALSPPKTDL